MASHELTGVSHEVEFEELMDAVLCFTGLVQNFNNVTFPLEKVYDRFESHLMLQNAVIVQGTISVILQQCVDKCEINKSGRN